MSRFPANPTDGMLFQQQPGCLFQFDAAINSWIRLISNDIILPLATATRAGAMSSIDLQKLNRLVLPVPKSTIIGNQCVAPFKSGVIDLVSGDNFVSVEGNVKVRNTDQFGDPIETTVPFHIHQHTYGFDFSLDLPSLVEELKARNRFKVEGARGPRGPKGETGDNGPSRILAGPEGAKGPRGNAPQCILSVEPEPIPSVVKPGLKKAFVGVRVVEDPDDATLYTLEFDRQDIGITDASASKLNLLGQNSTWVLAVTSVTGAPQPIYYIDLAPILNSIQSKFEEEIALLKKGYEDIVQFWIQTMSDLFDEQKSALCCALEFCMSKTKSIDARQHMETVAATALPYAKIQINPKDSSAAVKLSSMGGIVGLPDGKDLCSATSSLLDGYESQSEDVNQRAATDSQLGSIIEAEIDPAVNVGISNATIVDLKEGHYTIILYKFDANINNEFYAPIAIQYHNEGKFKNSKFLNKGRFQFLHFAQKAYQGLTTSIKHDGGPISLYYNIYPTENASGTIKLLIIEQPQQSEPTPQIVPTKVTESTVATVDPPLKPLTITTADTSCRLQASKLRWYENGWLVGRGLGCVINLSGQDYIIIKRSLGDDMSFGGGETPFTPCIAQFIESIGHPSIAWPTLDGKTFAPLSTDAAVMSYNADLSNLAIDIIRDGYYDDPIGITSGAEELADKIGPIIFPTVLQ